MLQVAGKSITFLVDTGATFSVLTVYSSSMVKLPISVMGVDGTPSIPPKTMPLPCIFSYFLLVVPVCPVSLLGWHILGSLGHPLSNPHNLS